MQLNGPLRFTLGEFDTAIEVYVEGDDFPRLRITPSGDYLTGTGEEEPTPTKGRAAKAQATASLSGDSLADEAITERHYARGSIPQDALSPSLSLPLSVLGRNPVLRSEHEGTQSLDTTEDSETRLAMTPYERMALSRIEPGATRNETDDYLTDRANHHGKIPAKEVTGLSPAAFCKVTTGVTLQEDDALPTAAAVRAYVLAQLAALDFSVPEGSITSEHLAPGAVTAPALAAGQIRNEHLADDAEIAMSRLVVDPLARGNHRGTQPASSVTGLGPLATVAPDTIAALAADWPILKVLK